MLSCLYNCRDKFDKMLLSCQFQRKLYASFSGAPVFQNTAGEKRSPALNFDFDAPGYIFCIGLLWPINLVARIFLKVDIINRNVKEKEREGTL